MTEELNNLDLPAVPDPQGNQRSAQPEETVDVASKTSSLSDAEPPVSNNQAPQNSPQRSMFAKLCASSTDCAKAVMGCLCPSKSGGYTRTGDIDNLQAAEHDRSKREPTGL